MPTGRLGDYDIGSLPPEHSSGGAWLFDSQITLNPTGYPTLRPQGQAKKFGYGKAYAFFCRIVNAYKRKRDRKNAQG